MVAGYLRSETFGLAAVHLSHIGERNSYPLMDRSEQRAAVWWRGWAAEADRALTLCRALSAAAHPTPETA